MKQLLIISLLLGFFILNNQKKNKPIARNSPHIIQPTRPIQPNPAPNKPSQPEIKYEPVWTEFLPVRSPNPSLGKVLSDVDSHLPAGHIYADSDRITHCHETSHGIASELRKKYNTNAKINCFYGLENRAVLIPSPPVITIQDVAKIVPSSLRGGVYNLYLVQQASSWGDVVLYLFDEHTAYINGSACRKDLQISDRSETVTYMLEFNVYSLCIAQKLGLNYNEPQFKNFLAWNIERSMQIYNQEPNAQEYLQKFQTNPDAEQLRDFTRNYLGSVWTKKVLGF